MKGWHLDLGSLPTIEERVGMYKGGDWISILTLSGSVFLSIVAIWRWYSGDSLWYDWQVLGMISFGVYWFWRPYFLSEESKKNDRITILHESSKIILPSGIILCDQDKAICIKLRNNTDKVLVIRAGEAVPSKIKAISNPITLLFWSARGDEDRPSTIEEYCGDGGDAIKIGSGLVFKTRFDLKKKLSARKFNKLRDDLSVARVFLTVDEENKVRKRIEIPI